MNIEDLRLDAVVVTSDGHTIGKLHRFVFRPDDMRLTHVVVDTGVLRSGEPLWKGGWGLTHDRLLPIGVIKAADSRRIEITMTGDDFKELAVPYTSEYFVALPNDHKGPDVSDLRALLMSMPGEGGPWLMQKTEQLAPGEEDVRAGSPVWRLDPHQKIGDVERVIFDTDSKAITGIVVKRGVIFTHEVVVPVEYIVEVVAEIVRVQMDDDELKTLPRFVAPD